jgi:hypothetical protein
MTSRTQQEGNEFSGSLLVGGIDSVDDDDEDLESFMTGLSMTRTALRRNGGGVDSVGLVDIGTGGIRENNVPSPARTPGRWSGAGVGTSSPSSGYVVRQSEVGQAGADFDMKVPSSVSIRSGSRSAISKKYKLYEVPSSGKGYEETCFSLIGQGTTFCTARKCKTAHQGAIFNPAPGTLFVCKSVARAFADPNSSISCLTPDLLVSWNSAACSLEEWSRLFMLVNASASEGPTSAAILEAKEEFATKAEAHRTPGKRKADPLHLPTALRASPYTRQLGVIDQDEERPFSLGSEQAVYVLRQLDEGLEKATHFMADLSAEQGAYAKEENLALRALEHKVGDLKREIGTRPEALSLEYSAPTMWGSMGALGSYLDSVAVQSEGTKFPTEKLLKMVNGAVEPLRDHLLEALAKKTAAMETRINKIKTFALNSAKHLQQCLNEQAEDAAMEQFGKPSGARQEVSGEEADSKPEWVHDVIKSFESRIENLSTRLSKVTADTDEQAVRFGGLGFRSHREANAWLAIHLPSHHGGLIVDAHVVLEHVQVQSVGNDSIKTMESLTKLRIKTMSDSLAMTSFEQKVPRFFKKSTAHKVVKDDASFFDIIVSHEEWDAPGSGYRAQLKEELVTFRAAHLELIDSVLERESIAYAIANMALTEAVAWIEGFIVFLDDYHRDLTKAKFGTKKAWNVATRLGKRIFEEIATPRNGVSNSFEAGNNEQVCQKIFWAVVRSHDLMARYKRNGFKDDPTVSAELVKFMAINTGFEALDTLVIKVKTMEADVAASKREALAANKAASSAANKSDEMKKTIDLLVKRIAKLEK